MILAERYHLDAFLVVMSALKKIARLSDLRICVSYCAQNTTCRPRVRTAAARFIGVGAIDNFLVSHTITFKLEPK